MSNICLIIKRIKYLFKTAKRKRIASIKRCSFWNKIDIYFKLPHFDPLNSIVIGEKGSTNRICLTIPLLSKSHRQMGVGSSQSLPTRTFSSAFTAPFYPHQSRPFFSFNPNTIVFQRPCKRPMTQHSLHSSSSSSFVPLNSGKVDQVETQVRGAVGAMYDFQGIDEELLQRMVYDALVWSSLHGLVVGDRAVKVSGERSIFVIEWLLFGLVPVFWYGTEEENWKFCFLRTPGKGKKDELD